MVRFIHCVRKRDDLTIEEFRRYWQSAELDRLIQRCAEMFKARYYAKNATLAVDANRWIVEMRNIDEPFDGIIEYWFENAAHVMDVAVSEPYHVLKTEMEIYQYKFINLEKSIMFFSEWEQVAC